VHKVGIIVSAQKVHNSEFFFSFEHFVLQQIFLQPPLKLLLEIMVQNYAMEHFTHRYRFRLPIACMWSPGTLLHLHSYARLAKTAKVYFQSKYQHAVKGIISRNYAGKC
jgi:hypothetical protein